MPETLWAPWRYRYIAGEKEEECIFCRAVTSKEDEKYFLLYRGKENFVILNFFPYNNGHIMIAPNAHIDSIEKSSSGQLVEMMELAMKCCEVMNQVYTPDGFNIGFNLGQVAGAGIVAHFHMHIVPRWQGDTNFMTILADTRVIPESPEETFKKLIPYFS